ncbi:hypothetical protein M0805_004537 [Coniferiporia weirii]|nr:hypothetical protein M0805_004537 [Coniferiporia weirii]
MDSTSISVANFKPKQSSPAPDSHLHTMRLFCGPATAASPFCTCKSHVLPPHSAELERAWKAVPDTVTTNSLADAGGDDVDDDAPIFYVRDMLEIRSATACRPQLVLPISPLLASRRSVGAPSPPGSDFSSSASSESSAGDGSSDCASVTSSSPVFGTAVLASEYEIESASVRAAHLVYHATESVNIGDPTAVLNCVEQAMRATQGVSTAALRSALRSITMQSFQRMWKKRSDLWRALERSAHPQHERERERRYGARALQLAAFAGALFAADVLRAHDLQACIDLVRGDTDAPRAALAALRALVFGAGDRACRAKSAAYMEALCMELEARMQVARDAESHAMMLEIRNALVYYSSVQAEKRGRSVKVSAKPSRPRKVALASWGRPSC